jgi:hypothetical protein
MSTTPPDTEKALQFLAGENVTDILKIKNAITRKSKMKCSGCLKTTPIIHLG